MSTREASELAGPAIGRALKPGRSALAYKREQAKASREFKAVLENGDEYTYCIMEGDKARITSCKSTAQRLCIPESLGGCDVVSLDDGSFLHLASVECVVCPMKLRSIGCRVFEGCHKLREVELNEGLESIGEEAFTLCPALRDLMLPCSLARLGVNVTGMQGNLWMNGTARVQIDPNSRYLLQDEGGNIYERTEDGLVLVDGSRYAQPELQIMPGTVAIGERAFAQNGTITHAFIPEGVVRIEDSAFRGCIKLQYVELPSTLREVRSAAFSCTGLKALHIPAACTHFNETSFVLGPVIDGRCSTGYQSNLAHITVDESHPRLFVHEGTLFERIPGTHGCSALLCTGKADTVTFGKDVEFAYPAALLGTHEVGTLAVHEGLSYPSEFGLLPHGSCKRLIVLFSNPREGASCMELELFERSVTKGFFERAFSDGRIDAEHAAHVYDELVLAQKDRLAQARQAVARLARPTLLDEGHAREYRRIVEASLQSICVRFGERAYWDGFDQLADAGIIGEANIPELAAMLSTFGAAPAAGYLLQLKQQRFGKATWDYGL